MLAKRGRYIVRRAEAVSREGGARRHHARLGVRIGGSGAKVAARQWGCQGRKPESFRLSQTCRAQFATISEPALQHPLRQICCPQPPERRSERPKHVSPRRRLVDKYAANIRPEWAKELLCVPARCISVVVGCHSFAPFRGVALLLPLPGRCPGLLCHCPIRGGNHRFTG